MDSLNRRPHGLSDSSRGLYFEARRYLQVEEGDCRLFETTPPTLTPRCVGAQIAGLVPRIRRRADPKAIGTPNVARDRADGFRLLLERFLNRRGIGEANGLRNGLRTTGIEQAYAVG